MRGITRAYVRHATTKPGKEKIEYPYWCGSCRSPRLLRLEHVARRRKNPASLWAGVRLGREGAQLRVGVVRLDAGAMALRVDAPTARFRRRPKYPAPPSACRARRLDQAMPPQGEVTT
jgi:hypothetical protein